MNSCILMVEIIQDPVLRSTSDNQMTIAEMYVQFAPPLGSRPEDRPPTIEVVAWNNLANEVKENYHKGDRAIVEGRLEMNTDEKNGYKEKNARLVANRIYHATGDLQAVSMAAPSEGFDSPPPPVAATPAPKSAAKAAPPPAAPAVPDTIEDEEIPF
jgi:single-strand DNA-binding protein